MRRRLVSLLLAVVMVTAMIPAQAIDALQTVDEISPFADVDINDWYYDAVRHVYENEIFNGTSETEFSPDGTMTRGMFVTVLGRMAGIDVDEYTGETPFTDVSYSAYYAPYVTWAAKYGITGGTGDGKFSPNALINREQMATFFVRYFELFGVDFDTEADITTTPDDIDQVSDYAKEAVLKLWKTGLLAGDGISFNPKGNATRAQAATLCKRVDEAVDVWYKEPGVPSERVRKRLDEDDKSAQNIRFTYYTFKFETNDGTSISDRSIRKGSRLNNLPTPYKENAIFVGWCYDEQLTQLVSDTDTAQASTVLYAKYEEMAPLNEEFEAPVASVVDADKNFTVVVTAPAGMTIDEFKEKVTLKNLSSNENKEWFSVKRSGSTFIISGVNYLGEQGAQQPGFVEGSAYKIILEDKDLFFVGQDESTREYVFTIRREEIVNASLNTNMRQIPLSDISNLTVNGAKVSSISIPVITVGTDGAPAENGISTGSFTYSKGTLAVGDTITIYEGNTPPSMDAVTNDEDTAFVEITSADGSYYTYKTASAENVLFTPDILPVSVEADTDGSADNSAITVPVSVMTYTDDHFALAGLDSRTTIDVGDFISFYSGTLMDDGTLSEGGVILGYARITSVEESKGNYIITYEAVGLSEVQESMAAYKKENISSDELLEGVDRQALEENVEKQARDSGFAEEAGMYLAALALETDSFTTLSDEYELTAVEMTMNGKSITQETIRKMGGVKAEVEVSKLQATLSTDLVHFKGVNGLRLTLDVGIKVTIECNDDVTIEIEIVGSFEQEVRIDIGVDGDAIWKWWGIFPYIAEYEVTAYVELYEYTGIGIEATIATIETDEEGFGTKNESVEKIGKQIKDLMDQKDKYIGDGKSTLSDSLEEKYSDMLQNETDWVTLVEKVLFDNDFRILLVVAINIEVKFVIQANLNISLGMDFWYENAKRYVYTIQVFSNKVKSDVIDLVEEHWEFEFYVMGTMGLRAGIKAGISVGLISTKIASVGFAAEAGAYVRVWGYFYYQLKYTASQGRSSSYSGAIYLEFGIYLSITFEAQALKGRYSYEYSLYEKEWPLLRAGDQDNVRDFAYKQKDVPNINLKAYITSTQIPDSLFDMAYLDLKEGMDEDENGNRVLFVANYDAELTRGKNVSNNERDDEKYFSIEMTNPAFSYDPYTNTITVTPGDQPKQDGEMIITWKSRPMEFSSVPIRRTVKLHWDNLRDGYVIVPYTNGGSYVPIIVKKYEEALKAPDNPTKAGYNFAGWYSDERLTVPYVFPMTMPNTDVNIYASWVPATDTMYRVEHYIQKLGTSEYELVESEVLKGTTDSTVTPLTKSYTGFITPDTETLVIKADGSSVLRYYYDRQTYTVTFEPGEVGGEPVVTRLQYGSTISAPQFGAKGFIFKGWNDVVSPYMGDQDLTYTAVWEKDISTEYRVEYYVQQPDGRYVLQDMEYRTGATGEVIEASKLRLDSFYAMDGVTSFRNITVNGEPKDSVTITGDGKTVIKVNYKREQYSVTFRPENGDADIVYTLYSEAEIKAPVVKRLGYIFSSWSDEIPATVGTTDLVFSAVWEAASGIAYRVKHIRQSLDDSYPDSGTLVEYDDMTGTTGQETSAEAKSYEGFTVQDFAQTQIKPDGSSVVEIRYSRNSYPVNWVVDDVIDTVQVKYGSIILSPVEEPTKQGYVFDRWTGFAEQTIMGTSEKTYAAVWKPATDTPYTVKHIRANLDGSYSTEGGLVVTERRFATTGAPTAASPKIYEGFTTQKVIQDEILPDGSTEVFIYYNRNNYNITWAADNNTYAVSNVTYGAEISVPDGTPVKTGYRFLDWINVPESMPAGDLNITARFIPNTYVVSFDMNGGDGEPLTPFDVTYDSTYGALPIPEYTGYKFERWVDASGKTISETTIVSVPYDHTLIAAWVADDATQYTVKHLHQNIFDDEYTVVSVETRYGQTDTITVVEANTYEGFTAKEIEQVNIDGDGTAVVEVYYDRNTNSVTWNINGEEHIQYYRYGQPIVAPPAARTGYEFSGWDMPLVSVMPNYYLNYTALWTAANYTVTLNGNGGKDVSAVTATYDSVYPALPDSSRVGYEFVGWFTAAVGGEQVSAGDPVTITKNTTLYAQWEAKSYSVDFDLNGAEGTAPSIINVTYDSMYTDLPEGIGTKRGHHFNGWYTAPNGGERITSSTVVKIAADTTLYAQWTPNTYSVRFDANGGDGIMSEQMHTFGQGLALVQGVFTKVGHSFAGWNTEPDRNGTHYEDEEVVINLSENHGDEITLYAQWSINSYTVTFNSVDGTSVEAITQLYDTEVDKPADPTKYGYDFAGWMNGAIKVSFPIILTENLNLKALWEPTEYTITYIGVEGVPNPNPSSYNIESETVTLLDPGPKTGYTFVGWYTDEALSEESKVRGIAIESGSAGVKTFYSKWDANTYGINFDDGTESNNAGGNMTAQFFTYDTAQALSSNKFTNPGYEFKGWGVAPNRGVIYTNGQVVKNLLASGSMTLYAQWEPVIYTISYALGSGASKANNPTTYTIETPDILLKEPSGINTGYEFLGWYNGEVHVTSIPRGSIGNIDLTAKWAHGGVFTLAATGQKVNGSGLDVIFTVTRTIPEGAVATSDPQHVYYRTVNGTAIGGTAERIHFTHVGGEDVFLLFNQYDTSKTFEVKQESHIGDSIVNSFTDGTSRYYDVELYKVVSTVGNCTGTLGSSHSVRRTLQQSADYKLSSSFYTNEYSKVINQTAFTVTDKDFNENRSLSISTEYNVIGMEERHQRYLQSSSNQYLLRLEMEAREINDGYQLVYIQHTKIFSYGLWAIELKRGEVASHWGRVLKLPMMGDQGDMLRTSFSKNMMDFYNDGKEDYIKLGIGDSFIIQFSADGKGQDKWEVRKTEAFVKVLDTVEPIAQRVAPMAYGRYKAGESVTIAVEFNEVIGSASNVTLNAISGVPVSSWRYVGGVGTNVLVFTGTLNQDFEVTANVNNTLVGTKPTVNGAIKDLAN